MRRSDAPGFRRANSTPQYRDPEHNCPAYNDCCRTNDALPMAPRATSPISQEPSSQPNGLGAAFQEAPEPAPGVHVPEVDISDEELLLRNCLRCPGEHRGIRPKATSWIYKRGLMGLHELYPQFMLCAKCFKLDERDPTMDDMYKDVGHIQLRDGIYTRHTTSSMIKHLHKRHAITDASRQPDQESLFEVGHSRISTKEQKMLYVSFCYNVICMDLRTLLIGTGTNDFLNDLQPAFTPPSATWTRKILDNIIVPFVKDKIKKKSKKFAHRSTSAGCSPRPPTYGHRVPDPASRVS